MSAAKPDSTPNQGESTRSSAANQRTIPPNQANWIHRETVLPTSQDSVPDVGSPSSPLASEFGRYQILECLGQGAMGTVYKARDTQLDRIVALKIPRFSAQAEPELLERFYREARSAATLNHPNICPVHDVGEHGGTHYISMGYIEGRPLSAFIKPGKPQPAAKAAGVVRKLALALEEAHRHRIVHRDLKPENVMVDHRGQPVIMDFGLAFQAQPNNDIRTTHGGVILGTPAYMSPEQVDGDLKRIGPASDVYSLGVMFYELLTGELPYQGSVASVLAQAIKGEPVPPSVREKGLDPQLEAICLKMMAADRSKRYASMTEAARALTQWLKGEAAEVPLPAGSRSPSSQEAEEELAALFHVVDADHKPIRETKRSTLKSQARPKRAQRGRPKAWHQKPWTKWAAAGLAGFVLLLGIVLFVRVGDQTVKIEIDDPSAQVFVDNNKVTIENLGATVELKPGEHKLEVRRGDVVVQTDNFQVIKGENPILRIQVEKPQNERPMIAQNEPPSGIPLKSAEEKPQPMPVQESTPKAQTEPLPQPKAIGKNENDGKPITASEPDVELNREVAEWVIEEMGGTVGYVGLEPRAGGYYVSSLQHLSKEGFFVYDIQLRGGKEVRLADMKRIAELTRLTSLTLPQSKITDEHLQLLSDHPRLFFLDLSDNPITDAGMAHIKGINNMKHLHLNGTKVTATGLRELHGLAKLTELHLADTELTDDSVDAIVEMRRLRSLWLEGTTVADKDIAKIKSLPNLWGLTLDRTQITNEALKTLSDHPYLHRLDVANTKITDEGLAHLSKIRFLISLKINGCHVTNQGIVNHVATLSGLTELHLSDTPLTDMGLAEISKMPRLRILDFNDTQVTPEAEQRFLNRSR